MSFLFYETKQESVDITYIYPYTRIKKGLTLTLESSFISNAYSDQFSMTKLKRGLLGGKLVCLTLANLLNSGISSEQLARLREKNL